MIDPALIAAAVAEVEAEQQPQQTRSNPHGLDAMLDPEVEDQINRARDWYRPFFDLKQVFRDGAAEAEAEQQPRQRELLEQKIEACTARIRRALRHF